MRRAYEKLLFDRLADFPCVGIIGPRQCGKTTFLNVLPDTWKVYDLEKQSDFQIISRDPDLFLRLNAECVALDETQILPSLFPALRVAIDQRRSQPGRFVITGSSSPELIHAISESLAGRICLIEMAPFSFAETLEQPASLFYSLLLNRATPHDFVENLIPRSDLTAIHRYWFQGGYPEPWLKKSKRFRTTWLDQYIRTYLYRDMARLFPRLNQNKYRLFMQLLSGLSGTIINYSDVSRSLGVSQPTVRDYFEIAHGSFVWRRIPPYEKHAVKRIIKHPRGYLRDNGLLHHLLRIPDLDALLGHPKMGHSWEGMVVEEIIRGLNAHGASFDYYYYRTGGGAEIDLILEGEFGLIPVEIKYRQSVALQQLRAMRNFIREHNCALGIVINNDETARLYDEKLVGVPFAYL